MRNNNMKLNVPEPKVIDPNKKAWYEKYQNLSSARFTYGNSGNSKNLPSPYSEKLVDDEIVDIKGIWGSEKHYKIVGYTENPPFQPDGYHAVAIMFEDQTTFEFIWFHFRSGKDIDVSTLPAEYFGDLLQQQWDYDEAWRNRDDDEEDDEDDDY